jgi:hypothetical protein
VNRNQPVQLVPHTTRKTWLTRIQTLASVVFLWSMLAASEVTYVSCSTEFITVGYNWSSSFNEKSSFPKRLETASVLLDILVLCLLSLILVNYAALCPPPCRLILHIFQNLNFPKPFSVSFDMYTLEHMTTPRQDQFRQILDNGTG